MWRCDVDASLRVNCVQFSTYKHVTCILLDNVDESQIHNRGGSRIWEGFVRESQGRKSTVESGDKAGYLLQFILQRVL